MTSASYYVEESLWKVFILPYELIYSVWGIPLVALQFLLYFLLLQKDSLKIEFLFLIVSLQVCFGFRPNASFDPRNITNFFLSLFIVGLVYSICRWLIRHYQHSPAPQPRQRNTLLACALIGLLGSFFTYLYVAIYWPNRELRNTETLEKNPERARNICHRVLSHRIGNSHDAFLVLIHVGNEESVPYLISALRWKPKVKNGDLVECTWGHCVQALWTVTNQMPGTNYADWAKWWEANKTKSRRQWILDGFKINHLPVSDPPDDAFIDSLVSFVGTRESNFDCTVGFLKQIPKDRCMAAVDRVSHSASVQDRIGAITCLYALDWPEAEARVSPFLQDSDPRVRKMAEMTSKKSARQKEWLSTHNKTEKK